MPRKWTDLDLQRIGWQEQSWPAIDALEVKQATSTWQALRHYLADLRENLAAFDGAADSVDRDRTLTDVGKVEKLRGNARHAIANCESADAFGKIEKEVKRCIENVRSKMTGLPAMPEDPVTAMLFAEIRAHLASEPKASRMSTARQLLKDQRVCGAIFNGPAFLSGLSEDEQTLLRTEAEHVLHPAERETVDQLTEALEAARSAARIAAGKVAERVSLAKAADGQWVPTSPTPRPREAPAMAIAHRPSQVA